MQFSAATERWRSTVARYFPPELVDKALWTIEHESGGDPGAIGDNGVAIGLFQIQDNNNFPDRPDRGYLLSPENNIRYAAEQLGAASGNFGDWGEGTSYQGQPFGAFGHNQWPGGGGGGNISALGTRQAEAPAALPFSEDEYYQKYARYQSLYRELYIAEGVPNPQVPPDDPRWAELDQIDAEMARFEDAQDRQGQDWDRIIGATDAWNATDPRRIDAENAANEWAREMDRTSLAEGAAATERGRLTSAQENAQVGLQEHLGADHFSAGLMPMPKARTASKEELFDQAFEKIGSKLPDVPGLPYPMRTPNPSGPGVAPQPPYDDRRRRLPSGNIVRYPEGGGRTIGGSWADSVTDSGRRVHYPESGGRSMGGSWGEPPVAVSGGGRSRGGSWGEPPALPGIGSAVAGGFAGISGSILEQLRRNNRVGRF